MPYDLYLNNINDKSAVIFDIGSAYTKLGFSGECSPRDIIPTCVRKDNAVKYISEADNEHEERELLISFLYDIYYRKLLVNPKDRRVVVLESILSPTRERDLLADVLFHHFEVPSILFAPLHLVSLFTLGLQSGLVLDCGHKEASTVPVYEGYHLLQIWQAAPLGGTHIERRLLAMLEESGEMIDGNNDTRRLRDVAGLDSVLTRAVLEDIKVRACAVSPAARAAQWRLWHADEAGAVAKPVTGQEWVEYPLHCARYGDVRLRMPAEVREAAAEVLFGDGDEEGEASLAALVLDAVMAAPVDCRRALCENILVVGGSSRLPGFQSRLLAELRALASTASKYRRVATEAFKVHAAPAEPHYTAWLGAAIFGELDTIAVRSMVREAYVDAGRIDDWVDFRGH